MQKPSSAPPDGDAFDDGDRDQKTTDCGVVTAAGSVHRVEGARDHGVTSDRASAMRSREMRWARAFEQAPGPLA